jgi:hypothetical protein
VVEQPEGCYLAIYQTPRTRQSGSGGFMQYNLSTLDSPATQSDGAARSRTIMSSTGEESKPPQLPPVPSTTPSPARSEQLPAPSAGVTRTGLAATPQPEIPLAWLGVVAGPGTTRGYTYVLLPNTIIGRAGGNVLLSGDRTISSQHARVALEPKEDGAEGERVFVIYDLASTNGTYVGARDTVGDEATHVYRRELHPGDYILLGQTLLVYLQA